MKKYIYFLSLVVIVMVLMDQMVPHATAEESIRSGDAVANEAAAKQNFVPMFGQLAMGIDEVLKVQVRLEAIAASVPLGENGRESAWFPKLQSIQAGLARLWITKTQTDLFALLPRMSEFLFAESSRTEIPGFVSEANSSFRNLSFWF